MTGFIQNYKYLLIPFFLLLVHAAWVLNKSVSIDAALVKSNKLEQFSLGDRSVAASEISAFAFSRLFGVEPEMLVENDAEIDEQADVRFLTLTQVEPKLIAVDEVANILTARLWLAEGQVPRIRSIKVGDTILHYQVQEISLNNISLKFMPEIEHSWPDSQLDIMVLHLFKPIAKAEVVENQAVVENKTK